MATLYGLPPDAVAKLCEVFAQYLDIETVVLYGSRAKGNYRPASDIDLTLKGKKLDLTMLLALSIRIDAGI